MVSSYVIVLNIPLHFHSSDLRSFFSESIESRGYFKCFHFRHRPQAEIVNTLELLVQNRKSTFTHTIDKSCPQDKQTLPAKDLLCCIVECISESAKSEILKKYNFLNWVDRNETHLQSCCIVLSVKVKSSSINLPLSLLCLSSTSETELELPHDKIEHMFELKPPLMMPQGNVGTPTKYFLELIQACRLPSKLISKLGLSFPKIKTRKYGRVPFNYSNHFTEETTCSSDLTEASPFRDDLKNTSNHHDFPSSSGSKNNQEEEEEEEWDRHEALHDDVTEQERNKERSYEEEIEVVWEKGGPGIVWYTDQQVWKEAEGDFDEQTSDDWDVDYSVYFEENGGDKDARDAVEMRRSTMWRQGEVESVFKKPSKPPVRSKSKSATSSVSKSKVVGSFERHTRGIGRRLMEKHGWRDGSGLGRSEKGIATPIESEGQKPKERKGLGYFGEKIPHFARKSNPTGGTRIATIYDNPNETDPPELLLQRNPPSSMKYRFA